MKLLNQGEDIVLDLNPHWWRIFPASLMLAVALIVGVISLIFDSSVIRVFTGFLLAAAFVYFANRYVRWRGENFVVTSERVIFRHGVITKKGMEIPLHRINAVFFSQSLFERILGAGGLVVESAGEGGQQTFESVRRPNLVQQEIYRVMEAEESRNFERQAEANAAVFSGPAALVSIPEQIEQLDALRWKGTITNAEFEAKKIDLLNRM